MMKWMRVHEKYKIRHKILSHLLEKLSYDKYHTAKLPDTETDLQEIATAIKVPFEKVRYYHHALHVTNAEHIDCNVKNGKHMVTLLEDGLDAAIDEHWLREGNKALNEDIYDKTKWLVPLLAFIVTAASLIYGASRISRMQETVQSLQLEVEKLKR